MLGLLLMQTHFRVQMEKNIQFKIHLEVLFIMSVLVCSGLRFDAFFSASTRQFLRCGFLIQKNHSRLSENEYCNIGGVYKKTCGHKASFLF